MYLATSVSCLGRVHAQLQVVGLPISYHGPDGTDVIELRSSNATRLR